MSATTAESRLAYIGEAHDLLSACRALIDAAERSIILQMYLFAANGDQTLLLPREGAFPYADTVASWLCEKKKARPDVTIVVLLDTNTPDNPALTRRRGTLIRQRLRRGGIIVLNACLFGVRFEPRRRWLRAKNFHLDHARVPLADWVEHQNRWQALHNVEDHRKNLVIDGGRAGAITSHNFFDAAFDWHENLIFVTGDVAEKLFSTATEAISAALSIPQAIDERDRALLHALVDSPAPHGAPFLPVLRPVRGFSSEDSAATDVHLEAGGEICALVENEAIRPRLVAMFDGAGAGDALLVATTYLSDLPLLDTLERAALRGARVRVLIDSIHALPLPPLHAWLTRNLLNYQAIVRSMQIQARRPESFELRVHDSRGGAMMHLKTAARLGARPMLIGGQANFTPNSFSRAWLETDIETSSVAIVEAFAQHFERLWELDVSRSPARERGRWGALGAVLRLALLRLFRLVGLRP